MQTLRPAPAIASMRAYAPARHPAPVDLRLDGNEGPLPEGSLAPLAAEPTLLQRYPDAAALERRIARRFGVPAAHVLVTAGVDDGLDRACRALLCPERELVLPVPTFEMLQRYAHWTGARVREVPWPGGAYPLDAVVDACSPETTAIAVVSPNNPTGSVATADQLVRLAAAAPNAVLLVDGAYSEFADVDLTSTALALPNALLFRTFSKAWGMAGLRVGFVIGRPDLIEWLRCSGHPYAVSGPSLAIARSRMAWDGLDAFVGRIRCERAMLGDRLRRLGAAAAPSQANFVLARTPRAAWLCQALAGLGIAVRSWPGHRLLRDAVRITCPGGEVPFERLCSALETALRPQALLLDMDGVLVDVRGSYRRAIVETAASFGVTVTTDELACEKRRAGSNNDWLVTQRLIERSRPVALAEVTRRFERIYQGAGDSDGLWAREELACDRALLERLARRLPLAIVSGRPRRDAERFLERTDTRKLFRTVVCMGDAPAKPDPQPVELACAQLGVRHAWMVGDTPDDVRAARAARVVPLGLTGASDATPNALLEVGAARVLNSLNQLEELLP